MKVNFCGIIDMVTNSEYILACVWENLKKEVRNHCFFSWIFGLLEILN